MREIAYEEKNFPEVLRLFDVCERSLQTDRPQQVHFNEITQKFEYYSPEEFDSIPDDVIFEHPKNAIDRFNMTKEQMNNAVADTDAYSGSVSNEEEAMEQRMVELDIEEIKEGLEDLEDTTFENDDPEVLKATTENLKVIRSIQAKLEMEKKENLARVLADIYKCDIISESDVAQAIVENDEFKKLLSMLFSMLNVTVSSTRVSPALEVSTGNLTFNSRIQYGLEDYRRGAAQCLADVRRLAESGNKINTLEETIKDLNSTLASTRKDLIDSNDKHERLMAEKFAKKELNLLEPVKFIIAWKKGDADRFLSLSSKAKLGTDGSYPTKYLQRTFSKNEAYAFTEEQARLQLARMIKHKDTLKIVDLKDLGAKAAADFFKLYKIIVEKV